MQCRGGVVGMVIKFTISALKMAKHILKLFDTFYLKTSTLSFPSIELISLKANDAPIFW